MTLADYCAPFGAQAELARELELPPQVIGRWISGALAVPVHRCPEIERITRGKVTCETLRPDQVWIRVKDREWRWHRRGRPAIDLTKCPPPTARGATSETAGA